MASYPKDRFDDLPPDLNRVGAHRAVPKGGRGWIAFAWAALASGVLVLAGLLGIAYLGNIDLGLFPIASTPTPTPTPTPTAEPLTDPALIATLGADRAISITVLNGIGRCRQGGGCGRQAGRLADRHRHAGGHLRHREDHRLLQRSAQRGHRARHRRRARVG